MAPKKKKAAKKSSPKRKQSTKKAPAQSPLKAVSSYSTLPKPAPQSKSVTISLADSPSKSSQRPSFGSSSFVMNALYKVHHYSFIGFLLAATLGFTLALIFASSQNWIPFLLSLLLFVIGVDKLIFSLRNKKEIDGDLHPQAVKRLHHFSAHVFFLLSLVGLLFGITFYLKGEWLMLLLSVVVVILGIDAMHHAKKNHRAL